MMEPKQPEANASKLQSDLPEASANEERAPLGFGSEGHGGGEGVDVEPQGGPSLEQGNQELLIQFDQADAQDILQPQKASAGRETSSEEERQESGNYSDQQSDNTGNNGEQQPQNVSFDHEDGSPQTRYDSDDTGLDTYAGRGGGDDGDNNVEGEHQNRYVLNPREFSIHVGTEADVSFGLLGNENRFLLQTQNTEGVQQEPPKLLFTTEEGTDYINDDDENGYVRRSEPSPPEADLNVEDEATEFHSEPPEDDLETAEESPELQAEPNVGADHDRDGYGNRYNHRFQPSATEDDLEAAQGSPELQFESDDGTAHDIDDYMNRYFHESQPSAPEADLETSEESPELRFEPDEDENQYAPHSQPSVPEADLDAVFPARHPDKYDDDDGDDDNDESNRYVPESQRVIHGTEDEESPELQFQPEDDKIDDRYLSQFQTSAQEVDRDAAAQRPEAAAYGDDDDGDDENHSSFQLHNVAQAGVEEESLQLESQQDDILHAAAADDDDDNSDGDGSRFITSYGNEDQGIDVAHDQHLHDAAAASPTLAPDDSDTRQNVAEYSTEDQRTFELQYGAYDVTVGADDDDYLGSPLRGQETFAERQIPPVPEEDLDENACIIPSGSEVPESSGEYESQPGLYADSRFEPEGDDDSPRVFIKGILSEGDVNERYAENAYDEENEEEEEDTDDAIDIRDNTNVEDQFIEFEDTSFVEAAVGGIMEDAGLNVVKNGSREEGVGGEDGATGEAATGADNDGDNDSAEGGSRASTSRVRFADVEDRQHHPGGSADDDDDYHIIPGTSDQTAYSGHDYDHAEGGEKSLDVLLLEEICEEAASMTIKEALIHSLKPNVRAGLTTAHLKLSESEVLALEEYCEDFVGGLIKDLLKRSSLMDLSRKTKKSVVKASVIKSTAKQLSAMEVQQMKIYCDHFVHNVIAESIIDSSMIVARQQHQAEEVKELLHMFNNSEELQEYFTNLTTDIVRIALLNVTAKEDLQEDSQDIEHPIESTEYEQTEAVGQSSYLAEGLEFGNQEADFDFDGSHSFGIPVADEYRRSRSEESWTSEDEGEMGSNVVGGRQRMTERSPPGHSTLEFDEEWAEGVIANIDPSPYGEKRQKIFMRELEFDDRANVGGTELLAPVFLAVAEENEDDTEFVGLRRKTQSIEDLCDLIEEEKEPPRKRASSLTQPKKKPRKKPRPNSFREQMEELKKEAITENIPDAETEVEHPSISPESPSSPKTSSEKSFNAYDDDRYRWHTIRVNNREKVLDLKLIEPYMKVITHGGVHMPTRAVIVVIAACYLPDKTKRNYDFLMEQLFFYLISTLELLATTDEYFLVYFNGGTTQNNQPALPWMKRFYQHVEGGLKKNMIHMFIVHPNFWLKTVVRFAKAFVGTNFWSKLQFIKSLDELSTKIPVEFIYVPDEVVRCDPKYKRVHNL